MSRHLIALTAANTFVSDWLPLIASALALLGAGFVGYRYRLNEHLRELRIERYGDYLQSVETELFGAAKWSQLKRRSADSQSVYDADEQDIDNRIERFRTSARVRMVADSKCLLAVGGVEQAMERFRKQIRGDSPVSLETAAAEVDRASIQLRSTESILARSLWKGKVPKAHKVGEGDES